MIGKSTVNLPRITIGFNMLWRKNHARGEYTFSNTRVINVCHEFAIEDSIVEAS